MKKVAITGSIAGGKSFILNLINLIGYKVFSCDEYVRDLYEIQDIKDQVAREIQGLKNFDKKRLIEIIYNDPIQRIKLEQIIHPKVRLGIKEFEHQYNKEDILFFEVPLLFENNFDIYFDYTISVYCSEKVRRERAFRRKNFNEFIYLKLKEIQLSQEEKRKRADAEINSENSEEQIIDDIKQIVSRLK